MARNDASQSTAAAAESQESAAGAAPGTPARGASGSAARAAAKKQTVTKPAAAKPAAAKKAGDFSKQGLASYEENLRQGVVMHDLKKYSEVPDILSGTPGLFSTYPEKATQLMVDYFTVTSEPKSVIQKRAVRTFLSGLPKWQFVKDVIRARRVL